ncbi:MAG: tRNA threonylcarbamoyladenosine dehydratase [Planctomycetes bacterium]|nr:tRNA threonylcarbamoyladenosine dehydratase [Planctomycetota bacterium]MCC7169641.1 tRNA threonylcarbamoyladenosine dehydratase [Planctomycetota bacterium]
MSDCSHDSCPEATPQPPPIPDEYRHLRHFDRLARLVGDDGMARLKRARVIVLGLGGVGSFTAESLARSYVGHLRLVDFDEVCVTNTNRQLHALHDTIGRPKAELMAERLRRINPRGTFEAVVKGYDVDTADELLAGGFDVVVDCTDRITGKCHMIATCVARGLPLVTALGAAAKWDPTRIAVADLADTHGDALGAAVRKILRSQHGFAAKGPYGVAAVFSSEPAQEPYDLAYEREHGFRCVCPNGDNGFLTCERRSRIDGTASFVTGTFGLVTASVVVRHLAGKAGAFLFGSNATNEPHTTAPRCSAD